MKLLCIFCWKYVRVNGQTVDTLEKLCELIVASTKYVRIELEGNLVAMVDLNTKKKSRGQLLKCHKVMFDISEDIEKAFPCLRRRIIGIILSRLISDSHFIVFLFVS